MNEAHILFQLYSVYIQILQAIYPYGLFNTDIEHVIIGLYLRKVVRIEENKNMQFTLFYETYYSILHL